VSNISVDYDVLNQRGSPAWFSDVYANIPTAGYKGRMFISTDTYAFYRDTGTGWELIGGPGTGTITGRGTSGQISYFNGSSTLAGSNNLFWDNTNGRLGIGTATPGASLDIHATGTNATFNGTGSNNATLVFQNAGVSKWSIGNIYGAGSNTFRIYNNVTSAAALTIDNTTNAITFNGSSSYGGTISLKQNGSITAGTGYTTLGGISAGQLTIYFGDSNLYAATFLNTSLSASRSYTLPDASGTFALLENTNTFTLTNTFSSASKYAAGVLFQQNGSYTTLSGYTGIAGVTNGLYIAMGTTAVQGLYFPTGANYGYTFPSASGTLALTSNLSSYLPLAGGTMTGPLILSNVSSGGYGIQINNSLGAGFVALRESDDSYTLGMTSPTFTTVTIHANNSPSYINTTGNFGFGNASPSYRLDITGTLRSTAASYLATSSGNVLIGTTTDAGYKLDVNGSTRIVGGLTGTSAIFSSTITSQVNGSTFGTATAGGRAITILASSGDGAILFKNASNGDGTLSITGTSTSMNYYFSTYSIGGAFQIANNGVITIGQLGSGTVTATSGVLSAVSDMNLKIEDGFIDNALEKIMGLIPRYYYWKEESGLPTNLRQLGFYAQEVNKALGEEAANTPIKENDKWGIYDRGMIAFLTKAVQELNEKLVRNNIN